MKEDGRPKYGPSDPFWGPLTFNLPLRKRTDYYVFGCYIIHSIHRGSNFKERWGSIFPWIKKCSSLENNYYYDELEWRGPSMSFHHHCQLITSEIFIELVSFWEQKLNGNETYRTAIADVCNKNLGWMKRESFYSQWTFSAAISVPLCSFVLSVS